MKLIVLFLLLSHSLFVLCGSQELLPTKLSAKPSGKLSPEENIALQSKCGHPDRQAVHKSINSERVKRGSAPWVVAVSRENPGFNTTKLRCSGTLISPRHVLAARHCLIAPERKHVWVEATEATLSQREYKGVIKTNSSEGKLIYLIPTIVLEENALKLRDFRFVFDNECAADYAVEYKTQCSTENAAIRRAVKAFSPRVLFKEFNIGSSDLVIFELDEQVNEDRNIHPACLSDVFPFIGQVLELYSFGRDGKTKNESSVGMLQHISVTALPCFALSSPDAVCIRSNNQSADHGDSGGGFTYERNEITYVTAVVSGAASFTENYFDYGQTAVAPHLEWICKHVGICLDYMKHHQIRPEIDIVDLD